MNGLEMKFSMKMSALSLAEAYRTRTISPVEVAEAVLDAAHEAQGSLNAFAAIDENGAIEAAKASERRWRAGAALSRLDGVPVSVKDNIYVAGMPTRFGSRTTSAGNDNVLDSPTSARLREAGCVLFGKTTMPDYAHKLVTDSPLTGITRNPWNLDHSPGGSSGGSAAAVSAGIGPLSIGSDGGGSSRAPAAWCGVVGLKPTFGFVPHFPRGAYGPLSHVGPIGRSTHDVVEVMKIITRPDLRDWYSCKKLDALELLQTNSEAIKGLRIAYSPNMGIADLEVNSEIADAVGRGVKVFEDLGADIECADPPHVAEMLSLGMNLWVSFSNLLVSRIGDRADELDPSLRELAELGFQLQPEEITKAFVDRAEFGQETDRFFAKYDLVIAPVTQMHAPAIDDAGTINNLRPYLTSWSNIAGVPAASIPCGFSGAGLPMGLQIIAGRWRDALVLNACRIFEGFQLQPGQDGFRHAPSR